MSIILTRVGSMCISTTSFTKHCIWFLCLVKLRIKVLTLRLSLIKIRIKVFTLRLSLIKIGIKVLTLCLSLIKVLILSLSLIKIRILVRLLSYILILYWFWILLWSSPSPGLIRYCSKLGLIILIEGKRSIYIVPIWFGLVSILLLW